jgi:hypothetical protein
MSQVFDKLLASRPVNQAAARVIGGGVHYEPDKAIAQRHWSAPPVTIPLTQLQLENPQFRNFSGVSFGRFKVIGYLGVLGQGKKAKGLWLVKCVCGDYESRAAKSILNPENRGDRCDKCRHLSYLKRTEVYLRNPTAPQPDIRDL